MYTAGELERASMALDKPMNGLEHRIMADIVRRIRENGDITAAADWQITRLVQLGMGMTEISAAINEALGSAEDITSTLFENVLKEDYVRDKSLYEAIGKVQIPFEENAPLQQLISAVTAQTNETMHNITQSLGFAQRGADGRISFTPIVDYYQKTLDNAMFDISSGAFDYNTVLNRTVKEMTNSGLRTVDYATGWSNRVPVAARRAVMTGMNQLTAKVNEDNAEELNTEWFEISWHSGARPSHWWGGRWYTKEQLTTVCNLGDVTGLCGANCYHDYSPVIPGISEPTYTAEELEELNRRENEPVEWKGKQYTKYEALLRQRRLETTMRAQRQEMALLKEGGADEDDLINCRARYNATSHEYAQFSEAMGIPQERERVYGDGLGTKLMQGKTEGGSGKESPVRVPPVGAKVTNKVTAEERRELLSRDKVDIADNAKSTEKASAVESWEAENYKNSTEKGLLILPDGTTKDFGGIEHHVTGKEEDIKLMDGATFTHNHPTDNTFSQNDIVTGLVKGNLKEMRAVTSTGDVHILVNNGATEQQRKKFNADYQQRRMKAANTADAKIRRGEKINKDEYVKSRLETFMTEHAEEYNLSYFKTRIDVNNPSIDKSAKNGIIKEKEELPRKIKSGSNTVDWSIVQSEEYSKKYTKLSDDERVSSAIETRAKWALNNRDGKNTEELYAISLKDGREVSRITDQNYDSAVKRTSKFTRELNAADESGEEILLLHNHPRGLPPSISDINALLKNKNVSGITVGHNGSIYRYTRPNKEIPKSDWSIALRRHKKYSDITSMEKALSDLSKEFGFEFEIL